MRISQHHYFEGDWFPKLPSADNSQLLLSFGCRALICAPGFYQQIHQAFPVADIIGCTTSGEIYGTEVYDDSFTLTAIYFEQSEINIVSANQSQFLRSFDAGLSLAETLEPNGLKYVLVLSDGQVVNGSELVDGISAGLPKHVLITGGMAGDGDRFKETLVWCNDLIASGQIILCGFYGEALKIGHGTLGGWSTFGPERVITNARGNVLYELDNQPALELYKKYLGEFSQQLPSSALRFPLSLTLPDEHESVVRTVLNINERDNSMVFAGDMPQGSVAKLMKASFSSLIDGASDAASNALQSMQFGSPSFALLISCVGRRLVLNQRAFEELEIVDEIFNQQCPLFGFYSYGEISPLLNGEQCRLHNQTMTITTMTEVNCLQNPYA